jgi:hypothetical protein
MSYPNSAPISGTEKGWGLVLAVIAFPFGLISLVGLLAGQRWARWLAVILGAVVAILAVVAAVWLIAFFLPEQESSYPYGPWFIFLAGLIAVLGLLAARKFRAGLRSTETD